MSLFIFKFFSQKKMFICRYNPTAQIKLRALTTVFITFYVYIRNIRIRTNKKEGKKILSCIF